MNAFVSHPCISCRYIKICGDKNRTEPCNDRQIVGRKVKGHGGSYFLYEIADSNMKCVGGADTVEDARAAVQRYKACDAAHGFDKEHYFVFRLDIITGERLQRISIGDDNGLGTSETCV